MAKTIQAWKSSKAVVSLPLKATVRIGSYCNDAGERQEYVHCGLENPFEGEELEEIRIVPRWKLDKGIFEYRAKKLLKQTETFELEGELKPRTYYNKKKRKDITHPALLFADPFGASDKVIEFACKREEDAGLVSALASTYFDMQLESESAPEDTPIGG